MREFLLVGLGGFFGSIARYGVYLLALRYFAERAYTGTLIVNLAGCLLIGLLSGGLIKLTNTQSLLLITGICGGFTTFSTFAFDGIKLLKEGLYTQFLVYASVSVLGGLLLCFGGFYLTNRL